MLLPVTSLPCYFEKKIMGSNMFICICIYRCSINSNTSTLKSNAQINLSKMQKISLKMEYLHLLSLRLLPNKLHNIPSHISGTSINWKNVKALGFQRKKKERGNIVHPSIQSTHILGRNFRICFLFQYNSNAGDALSKLLCKCLHQVCRKTQQVVKWSSYDYFDWI